ncbi:hypothetical protein D3C84_792950 [compost metagenome]
MVDEEFRDAADHAVVHRMRDLHAQSAELVARITAAQHFADVLLPPRLGTHDTRCGAAATRRVDQSRTDMPEPIAGQDRRAQGGGLFDPDSNRQPRQYSVQRLEVDDFGQRIELGPGEDFHHLALERPRIDFQWHLPGIFGKRRRQQLDPIIKDKGCITEHLLVIERPHY